LTRPSSPRRWSKRSTGLSSRSVPANACTPRGGTVPSPLTVLKPVSQALSPGAFACAYLTGGRARQITQLVSIRSLSNIDLPLVCASQTGFPKRTLNCSTGVSTAVKNLYVERA
jgi:hypothetical protein